MGFVQFIQSLFFASLSGISNLIVYVGIVALFVMGIWRCVLPVVRTRALLRRAIRSIREGGDDKYAWQEDGFLGRGSLFSHWSEYLNNLFFADGRYHNASNVEDYINEETVIYGPGRASFAEALPGLLTSLGFLGTLVGLAQGLSGFSMTDSAAVQQSIVTLIPGMRYAFMTSIFGVIGSVLFTLITRAVYGSTEHTLTQFYSAMSRHAGVLSVDPMTQIAIYQQEQTALIKSMAKDLNGKLTETVSESVIKGMEPLEQTMKGFVNGITREQARLIDNVLDRFLEHMDDSLRGSLKRFGGVLDETSALQQESCQAVRASLSDVHEAFSELSEMKRVIQDMLSAVSEYTDRLADARQESDDTFMRMNAALEQVALVSRQQSATLKDFSGIQDGMTRSAKEMTDAIDRLAARVGEETRGASAAVRQAAGELRASGERLAAVHAKATQSISDELNTTLDAYMDYVNQFTQRVDYLANNISESLGQMPAAVEDTNNRFLDQMDAMIDALEQARNSLLDASNRMYGR